MMGWLFAGFNDKFFFWTATICAVLAFVDWAIGPKARAAMREKVAEWWIVLDDNTFAGLVAADANRVRSAFLSIFGRTWYSTRRIIRSGLLSCLVFLSVLTLLRIAQWIPSFDADYAVAILAVLVANGLLDWLLLNITIGLLGVVAASPSLLRLSAIAVIGFTTLVAKGIAVLFLFAAVVLVVGSVLDVLGVTGPAYSFLVQVFGEPDRSSPDCVECVFQGGIYDVIAMTVLAAFLGCVWSLFNIFNAIVFGVSKLFKPVVKPVASWLLYRFQESDKGVLTLASVGLGGLAKVLQQGAKAFL